MSSRPLTLLGSYIDLEPLCHQHQEGLSCVVADKALWHNNQTLIPTPELVTTYIELSLKSAKKGQELPFAILSKKSQKVVGSIKLQSIDRHSAEIGSTFIALSHQKTAVNSEAKLILMEHAFEILQLEHLNFRIHKDNEISQNSIERMGIIHKTHCFHQRTMPQWENYNYYDYCVTKQEWSDIKENLQNKLFSS